MNLIDIHGNTTEEILLNNNLVSVHEIDTTPVSFEAGTVVVCCSGGLKFSCNNRQYSCSSDSFFVLDRNTVLAAIDQATVLSIALQEPATFTPPRNMPELFSLFSKTWSPRVAAETATYQVKLAKLCGEFVWHSHDNTDELFVVIKGDLRMEFRHHRVHLEPMSALSVPRNMEHLPIADDMVHVMIVEPKGVVNTGNAGGDLTAQNNVKV